MSFMGQFNGSYPYKTRFSVRSFEMGVLAPLHDFVFRQNLELWDRALEAGNGSLFQGIAQLVPDITDIGYLPVDGSDTVWLSPARPGNLRFFIRMAADLAVGKNGLEGEPKALFVGLENKIDEAVELMQLDPITGVKMHTRLVKPVREIPPEHDFKTFELNVLNLIDLADSKMAKMIADEGAATPSKRRTRLSNLIGQLRKVVKTLRYNKRSSTNASGI